MDWIAQIFRRRKFYEDLSEELSMGLRPTHMDENRLEPKGYHRTGAERQRPSRLWIS